MKKGMKEQTYVIVKRRWYHRLFKVKPFVTLEGDSCNIILHKTETIELPKLHVDRGSGKTIAFVCGGVKVINQ